MFGALAGRRVRAESPVPVGSRRAFPGLFARSSAEHDLAALGSNPTLYAVIHRLSVSTAQVEWHLYRRRDGRGKLAGAEDRREAPDHPAIQVWNKPNPYDTRFSFVETFMQHLDLVGEAFLLPGRFTPGVGPLELWCVRPDRMSPRASEDPYKLRDGWTYEFSGLKAELAEAEVMQLRYPNPMDPNRGLGPVQTLLTDLDAARYSAEWNRNFFLNSAEPGGIIEVPNGLTDKQFDEFATRWNEQHKGVENAHRVAIIEHGKWVNRSFSMRDMQFVELRGVSDTLIRTAFGISKTMIGQTEDVNRATAQASMFVFAAHQQTERLRRIKEMLNHQFLPLFPDGRAFEFDYDSPVPDAPEEVNAERDSKTSAVATLVAAGFEPASVLATIGMPPISMAATAEGGGSFDPEVVARTIQMIYLGVDKVVSNEEARSIISALGYPLPGELEPGEAPEPPGGDDVEDDPGELEEDPVAGLNGWRW